MESSRTRTIAYALTSFLLGVWTFVKANAISETHSAGALMWMGVVVVNLPWYGSSLEASGQKGATGSILYAAILSLLFQIFGVPFMLPMMWIPSFVFGEGQRGAPLTNYRTMVAPLLSLPMAILTILMFTAQTESQHRTKSAVILDGPSFAMGSLAVLLDALSKLVARNENIKASSNAMKKIYNYLQVVGLVGWYILVAIAHRAYGTSLGDLWDDIWVNANASVRFMIIDTGVLYLAMLLFLAYHCGASKAARALLLTTVLGPAAACCVVLIEEPNEAKFAVSAATAEKKVN